MSYYVRAFCTSADLPPVQSVLDWAKSRGVELEAPNAELTASDWEQAEITYAADRGPLVAEISRGDDLLQEEVEEFRELLEDADDSTDKRRVLGHLDRTKAVVALQLLGDIDDAGYTAADTLLDYYVQHCGALVQADGEGFYDGERLIVALE